MTKRIKEDFKHGIIYYDNNSTRQNTEGTEDINNKTRRNKRLFNIKDVEDDYRPSEDKYFLEEDNLTYQIKNILFTGLTTTERWIFLLYCEKKSLRKTGKILGVSTSKTYQVINAIRNKIKDQLKCLQQ